MIKAKHLKVVKANADPENILRTDLTISQTEVVEVVPYAEAIKKFCDSQGGIGIAANQLGLRMNFFFMAAILFKPYRPTFCINPVLLTGKYPMESEEGCLSLPGFEYKVQRYTLITVRYNNLKNQVVEEELYGMSAKCFQHELDHLRGVILPNKVGLTKTEAELVAA